MRAISIVLCIVIGFFHVDLSSQDFSSTNLIAQKQQYQQNLNYAVSNWCVFDDKNGLDPTVYNLKTAEYLTGAKYDESLHKNLLLSAFKCSYDETRLTYLDFLVNYNLLPKRQKINFLSYGLFYTHRNNDLKEKHNRYKSELHNLVSSEEYTHISDSLNDYYGLMACYNRIFEESNMDDE